MTGGASSADEGAHPDQEQGRATRQTDSAVTPGADDQETTSAMSDINPDRTRLGSHKRDSGRQ